MLAAAHFAPGPAGVGTRRECELTGGKHYLRERLTGCTPGREMTIELYESSLPLKRMTAILQLTEMSDTATEVSFVAEFAPKGGLFGRLVQPLMKRRFAAMLRAMLNGNAEYIENNMRAALAA